MTVQQIWVIYAGVMFCAGALVMFGAVKALGAAYRDRITVNWPIRASVFCLAVISFVRGITLVFPGRSVHVQFVPWMVPAMATALFLVVVLATEWIISHRAPPPVMHRIQAAFAALATPRHVDVARSDALVTAAGVLPEAGDDPVRLGGRRLRYAVITVCGVGLLCLLLVVLHAAAAELPR